MNPKPITGIKSALAERTDEDAMALKEFHEEMRTLMESRAYALIRSKLEAMLARSVEDLIRRAASGDAPGAGWESGKIEALRFAIGLPQQLLSQS